MRRLTFLLFLLSQFAFARTYTTVFPNTQNPLTEAGNWTNGLATGVDWANVQSTPGVAFGTNVSGAPPYNDSIAYVNGSWGPNQTSCATVALDTSGGWNRNTGFFEVEVHLRRTITSHTSTGYEFNYSVKNDGSQYAQMVLWNGALNSFTVIVGNASVPALVTGDILCAAVTGSSFTFTRNGASILSHTDTSIASGGGPGIGFFNQGGVTGDNPHFGFSTFTGSDASTVTAASCSSTDVQTAINSISAGTVMVPAGSCTWTTPVTINAKTGTMSAPFILQGATTCTGTPTSACTDNTNITDSTSGDNPALNVTGLDATHAVKVSNLTFTAGTAITDGLLQLHSTGVYCNCAGFIISNIHIKHSISGGRGIETVGIYGLISHILVSVTDTTGSDQTLSIFGSDDGADGGFTPWTNGLTLGTANAVYLEDSTFNYGSTLEDSIDAYAGARFVIRYNAFNHATIGWHGTDSGNRRSPFSFEVYNNTFTNNSGGNFRSSTVRGGTGVFFNNTYGGPNAWTGQTLMVYRACPPLDQSAWGTCASTDWEIGSTNFASNASRTCTAAPGGGVKFCSGNRDLVCTNDATCSTASAGTCSTFFDSQGTGKYACRDQPGQTHGQVTSPVYTWSNTGNGDAVTYNGGNSCGLGINNYLQSGRDYINGTPMPGYVAYTYPYPVGGGGGPTNGPTLPAPFVIARQNPARIIPHEIGLLNDLGKEWRRGRP